MRKQVVKRHANTVRRCHFYVPRQARVVQLHVWDWRFSRELRKVVARDGAFQLVEQNAHKVTTEVPEDRGFPEGGKASSIVQSP